MHKGFFPDAWEACIVRLPEHTRERLAAIAGAKYSYRQLDDFSDLIAANIRTIPQVKRVLRSGFCGSRFTLSIPRSVSRLTACARTGLP